MESIHSEKKPDVLKSEHLAEGEKPIIACIEGYYDTPIFREDGAPETVRDLIERKKDELSHMDGHNPSVRESEGFIQGPSYFISPVNASGKTSEGFLMCTGVAAVGRDKATGENVSFLSHSMVANPLFNEDLQKRLAELRERCVPGTLDVVIAGGKRRKGSGDVYNYERTIGEYSALVRDTLGFDPTIMTGPKLTDGDESIYFDTANRRLYISRPKVGDSSSESYTVSDYSKKEGEWKKDF